VSKDQIASILLSSLIYLHFSLIFASNHMFNLIFLIKNYTLVSALGVDAEVDGNFVPIYT